MKSFSLLKNYLSRSHRTGCLFLSLAMAVLVYSAKADNIVANGTTLRVSPGTTLVSSANLVLNSGATLNNSGTIVLKGNLNNQNAGANSLGNGTIAFSGAATQTISGSNIFQNLSINNAGGITNNGSTYINGTLTLTSGVLALGSNHLTLGASAGIAGSPSVSAMIAATGSGELRKSFSAAGSFLFPVGDNTGAAEYAPVTLNFTSGSFSGDNYAGINLVNSAYPGAEGSFLNRYWNVTQNGISLFSCNATFQYTNADVNGTESSIWCVRVLPEPQTNYQAANTTLNQLTALSLSAFGTFTGKLPITDRMLNLTLYLEGLYNGVGSMRKTQNETGDQYGGNTADLIQVELHSAADYSDVIYTANDVSLSTAGLASANIPAANNASYYITVKHRNSISATSSAAVPFAGSTINYAFTNPANVYGGNVNLMVDGFYTIFGGDVNQDGVVDTADMTPVDNDSAQFSTGYLTTDVNGDGTVDTADMTIIDNNSAAFVSAVTP